MRHPGIPDFSPRPENETPIDALDRWSEANWASVPELVRRDCEQHLRDQVPADIVAKWADQRRRGVSIGSDDPRFHFGVGMQVRNCLRDQLTDGALPEVTVDHDGKAYGPARNWDDYYFGVLAAIAG